MNDVDTFRIQLSELEVTLTKKEMEMDMLKEVIKTLNAQTRLHNANECEEPFEVRTYDNNTNCSEKEELDALYNVASMRTKMTILEKEMQIMSQSFSEVKSENDKLQNKIYEVEQSKEELKKQSEEALSAKVKAELELQVLSRHYKEKELEFGREMGIQEVKWQQKEENTFSLTHKLESMIEENELYKQQIESLRLEQIESDKKWKLQFNQLEKQAHESWIQARNAERKLEEAKTEAAVLRQTLTKTNKSPFDGFLSDLAHHDGAMSTLPSITEIDIPPPPPPPPMPPQLPPFNGVAPPSIPYGAPLPPMPPFSDTGSDYGSGTWNTNLSVVPPPPPSYLPFNDSNESLPVNNSSPYSPNSRLAQRNHWDSISNRDTFSPNSHDCNNSRGPSPSVMKSFQTTTNHSYSHLPQPLISNVPLSNTAVHHSSSSNLRQRIYSPQKTSHSNHNMNQSFYKKSTSTGNLNNVSQSNV